MSIVKAYYFRWVILVGLLGAFALPCAARQHDERTGRTISEVIPTFQLANSVIKRPQVLKIRVTLQNRSNSKVSFRYFKRSFIQHIVVYERKSRKEVALSSNAPYLEAAPSTVRLEPKQIVADTVTVDLWAFYDLDPGEYFIKVRYDFRLINDEKVARKYMRQYHTKDFAIWDTREYSLSVRN